ncbi:DUF1778 domain-containing protein [Zhongshania sp. BJYM1]|uniref:type II toxin-antitoxin system TacA family antitoxin n=1 Tax=Zhongshania aquatica TaxID=2965069 RepID=UPI0022B57663|nr:DUF1778 domain-containing protein [Marortus sp. BJYM1]
MKTPDEDIQLVAWVTKDLYQFIQTAAELSGCSVSQFFADAAVSTARAVTEQATQITLSMNAAEQILTAIANPPPVSDSLQKAAVRHREKNYYESDFSADPKNEERRSHD